MPQAVSIFPSPPPQSNSTPANQSSGDWTPSRFDDVLNDARQKDSSTPAASSTPSTDATDKSSKPAKNEKPAKSSRAKPTDATRGGKAKDVGQTTPVENAEEDVTAEPVVPATDSGIAVATAKPKGKDAAKTEHGQTAAAIDPNAVQEPVLPLKKPKNLSEVKSASKAEEETSTSAAAAQPIDSSVVAADPNGATDPETTSPVDRHAASGSSKSARPNLTAASADQTPQDSVGIQPDGAATTRGISPTGKNAPSSTSTDDVSASAPGNVTSIDTTAPAPPHVANQSFADVLGAAQGPPPVAAASGPQPAHAPAPAPRLTPDAQFADANHPAIVTGVHSTLLPNGGTMRLRLDPPDLGAMDISVQMRNGTMTATFDTSNDQASRMLSHSLGQLKTALEAQGVTVGGLHVQQSPRSSDTGSNSSRDEGHNQGNASDASAQQQEQQRKDMLKRMWKKLNGVEDPLDLVA